MALQLNAAASCFYNYNGTSNNNQNKVKSVRNVIRAVTSVEDNTSISTVEKIKLGGSDLEVTKLGIGAWSWGDTSYWNNFEWDDRKMKAAKAAFDTSLDYGINFIDTAEVYGSRVRGLMSYSFDQLHESSWCTMIL
ncbi:unnamed protein product [Amaranthus hypochondriacus]